MLLSVYAILLYPVLVLMLLLLFEQVHKYSSVLHKLLKYSKVHTRIHQAVPSNAYSHVTWYCSMRTLCYISNLLSYIHPIFFLHWCLGLIFFSVRYSLCVFLIRVKCIFHHYMCIIVVQCRRDATCCLILLKMVSIWAKFWCHSIEFLFGINQLKCYFTNWKSRYCGMLCGVICKDKSRSNQTVVDISKYHLYAHKLVVISLQQYNSILTQYTLLSILYDIVKRSFQRCKVLVYWIKTISH